MKKRILLFWPNTSNRGRITMSIPILSSIAKKMGWETKYFDTSFYEKSDDSVVDKEKTGAFKPIKNEVGQENLSEIKPSHHVIPDLQKTIDDFHPDLIAITGMTNDFQYMMTFWPKIRIPTETKVLFGGIHALHMSKEILDAGIDMTCFGQGEKILPEILKRVEQNRNITGIPGTCHLSLRDGTLIKSTMSSALPPEKLWNLSPDYSFFDQRYYSYPFDGKMVNMFWLEVGRGCPYGCTYYEAPQLRNLYKGLGKYVVSRPMNDIFDTIKQVQKQYPIDVFNITHECFLSQKKEWLKEFCERWGKEVKKSFLIQTRMETVDEEKLDILRTSNAPVIQIGQGIESGSQRILKDICNRRMNIEKVVKSYKIMKERGFRTNAFYMIGFPTETKDEIFETIDLCRWVNADIDSVSIFQPYPGLPLSKMCVENGWIKGDETIPSFTEKSIINQPSISPEEVTNLRRVFLLYAKLPYQYHYSIKKCEDNPDKYYELFQELVDLRWKFNKEIK